MARQVGEYCDLGHILSTRDVPQSAQIDAQNRSNVAIFQVLNGQARLEQRGSYCYSIRDLGRDGLRPYFSRPRGTSSWTLAQVHK